MANTNINFSNSTPAAPSGRKNIAWQGDTSNPENVSGNVPADGGAVIKTADYVATVADDGLTIVMNGTSKTLTLPAAIPDPKWRIWVTNINATSATIARNGKTIDGATANLSLDQYQGVYITTDGSNYVTDRGMGSIDPDDSVLTGDATKLAGSQEVTVVRLRGKALASAVETADAGEDGYLLGYASGPDEFELISPEASSGFNASKIRGVGIGIASPLDADGFRYNSSTGLWEPSDDGILINSWGLRANGQGSAFTGMGISFTTIGTIAVVTVTGSSPVMTKISTSAAGAASAGISVPNESNRNFSLGTTRVIKWRMLLGQTANMRIWAGLASTNNSATLRSDTPNISFAGFRYSTSAGDAKYQCVTQTSNVAQTVTPESTSSHVDTSPHSFELRYDGSNVLLYIDRALVGSQNGNIPSTSTAMWFVVFVDNSAATSTANNASYQYVGGIQID